MPVPVSDRSHLFPQKLALCNWWQLADSGLPANELMLLASWSPARDLRDRIWDLPGVRLVS